MVRPSRAALLGALGAREVDDLYLTHMVAVGATMLLAGLAACVDALRELLGTVALAA